MEVGKLNAQLRTSTGTGTSRKIRRGGKIPAVLYGAGEKPVELEVSPTELQKALDPIKGRNTLLHLQIEGGPAGTTAVLLKDAQRHKLRGEVLHADFLRVQLNKPVRAIVPLALTGKAEGVKNGGTMHQVYRTIDLFCLPERIPTKVEIDVTPLGIGQAFHVSDLKLPEGVTAAIASTTTLCVVTTLKAEKAETAAEGAAPAEGAAAPAAGEKGAASAKTPAPAAAGGKDKAAAPAKAAPAAKK
jgi:large subunit ribosomal protein L25